MGSLMLAAEGIYMLPYMRKSFQTSMQEVFGVTFTQLGFLNTMFGILALISYFAGGWLSDRISTRKLLSFSLFATGLGGYYMATMPSYPVLLALHAFWGVTSILTFWAALVKAARLWGGEDEQGKTFGILNAGQGIVGASLASLAAWVFSLYAAPSEGLVSVIVLYSTASIVAGITILAFVPVDTKQATLSQYKGPVPRRQILTVLKMPVVWLQAFIILFAYWLYLGVFEFPAFVEKVLGQDKVFGAQLGAFREWMKPVAAIGAGFLADRIRPTRAICLAFGISALGYGVMSSSQGDSTWLWAVWIQVSATAIAVFALRGIYYALLEESKVPIVLTGTAVGVISTISYTPDIFAFPLVGWFLDEFGASLGYQYYFRILAGTAVAGLLLTMLLGWLGNRRKD
ncbi:MAG: MFS transporter [Pseudomonadales bacterium]